MAQVQIKGIQKDNGNHFNPNEAIEAFCWMNPASNKTGKATRLEMVQWIEEGNQAYVQAPSGTKIFCYVRTSSHGVKFLQTYSNETYTDNLLSLPEC